LGTVIGSGEQVVPTQKRIRNNVLVVEWHVCRAGAAHEATVAETNVADEVQAETGHLARLIEDPSLARSHM
jgi:hypothetical protein